MMDHNIETGTPQLLAGFSDGVFILTMNRPEARNALTFEMLDAMSEQLARAEADKNVRCVILTGAGSGFCAGGDVKAMIDPTSDDHPGNDPDNHVLRQRLVQRGTAGRLFHMPKPTLAVINGPAAGAGLALALACDLRLMSSNAALTTAFSRVGLPGDFGGTYFMTQMIGTARARELFFLPDLIPAEKAVDIGIANWACPPERLAEETRYIAHRLATGPSIAYRYMKENLNRAITARVGECLDLEASYHVHCMSSVDHREAAAAFVEKRTPVFVGA
ncbi:enoyl-CoA hydratase-related protein [Sphingobium fuliginis]|uniref:Enoyl-CoA hydratase n=1 Tax=Sphingobium fuliginis ATCC 27551 TaxID=1208342 RepID=A0A5B8CFX8_SPHSA|nr:enoyl-CoA hydratase-related protein [Sphingobium fuliginis]QDC37755.1 enoyl-CoA hydratase [Sphingobium fuliginis ATCC 27551]